VARFAAAGLILTALLLFASTAGAATTPPLGAETQSRLDALAAAASAARSRSPDAVQARYDLARETEDALALFTPTPACRLLYDALDQVAHGNVTAAEGFDRLNRSLAARGESAIHAGTASFTRARAACPGGIRAAGGAVRSVNAIISPGSEEVFYGTLQIGVPMGAKDLVVRFRRSVISSEESAKADIRTVTLSPTLVSGRGKLTVSFRVGARRIVQTQSVWLLPSSAQGSVIGERPDSALDARLATLAAGFSGVAAIYVHDLTSGRTGRWNDTARFPAASTVKLGVLAAALARGSGPASSPFLYDMRTLAAWSSNLAANRLLRSLGNGGIARGSAVAEAMLRKLGATQSTYPGEYRVGTAHETVPTGPPLVSKRTTSARDLGRVLTRLQAAAAGRSGSPLSAPAARIGLALLLDSQPSGDNVGLLRPALPARLPAAQKQGWVSSARHTAAIVYGPRGPMIIVLLTSKDQLSLAEAQQLGRKVTIAALA
jgi:beta-lactamase class A